MLTKEGADKERNRLILVKHTHTQHKPVSKTYSLMLAMDGADKKRKSLLQVKNTHTQHKTIQ